MQLVPPTVQALYNSLLQNVIYYLNSLFGGVLPIIINKIIIFIKIIQYNIKPKEYKGKCERNIRKDNVWGVRKIQLYPHC